MIWALGLPILIGILILFSGTAMPFSFIIGLVLAILIIILVLFFALTVEVNNNTIIIMFGFGILRRSLKIKDINNVQTVRNYWHHGWGIRFLPNGEFYSVSGFDAVEIELHNKAKYRIGTDDPQGLLMAIREETFKAS